MSRIDDLIAEHCPDGVPYKRLEGITTLITDGSHAPPKESSGHDLFPMISAKNIQGGRIDFVGARMLSKDDFHSENRRTRVEVGDILLTIVGAIGRAAVVETAVPMVFQRSVCVIKLDRSVAIPQFMRYMLESTNLQRRLSAQANGAAQKGIYLHQVAKIVVPVPPLEVQREIVRILDTFTALEAELEAELEARRIQYSTYWNTLLTPDDTWRKKTVGEIADVFDGPHATPKKTDSGPWYLSISSLQDGKFDLSASAHLGFDQYDQWTKRISPQVGDTLFSYETRLGQAAYWDVDEPAALGRRMGLLRPKSTEVLPKFLTYCYLGPEFQRQIRRRTVSGATVDRIPIANLPDWPISIPEASVQERIVQTLDSFNALTNDLSIGLPAELNARRQQYEYYRDRLLTFKELPA